ncbi:MAG: hypothetical protein IJV40_10700 [Oscillospiraceae bacterium]|nr:hypothetical protein [Oscillospiraceae bacterium]
MAFAHCHTQGTSSPVSRVILAIGGQKLAIGEKIPLKKTAEMIKMGPE